jgi:hypothetical protein
MVPVPFHVAIGEVDIDLPEVSTEHHRVSVIDPNRRKAIAQMGLHSLYLVVNRLNEIMMLLHTWDYQVGEGEQYA